jgi:hypothetical protein
LMSSQEVRPINVINMNIQRAFIIGYQADKLER